MGSVTSNPNITISLLPAAVVDAFADRRDVIFGQVPSTATGAHATGLLTTNVHALTTAQIKVLFGATSYMTQCVLDWKSANESYSPLDCVSITEGAVAVSTGTITPTGNATSATTITVSVIDENKYSTDVSIVDTSTPTQTSAAIFAALEVVIGAVDAPFTNTDQTTSVDILSVDKGLIGDDFGIKIDGIIPGVVITITPFAGGGINPTLTGLADVIEGIRYTGVIWPEAWGAGISEITTEMESRFNASNAIMDGTIFTGATDIYATDLAAPNNLKTVVMMGTPKLALVTSATGSHTGQAALRPADWVACEFLGVRSRRLTPGAPIADDIISTSGGLDAFGGPSLASLPYFNTPLTLTPVTPSTNLWTSVEQAALEDAGFTTYGVNSAQNAMIMGPVVTTWVTDAGGNANDSFHYLNYVDTGSACREIFFNVLKSTYAQSRLTEGDLIAGRSMANAESIKAELLRIYKVLSGLALTQAGREASSFFATNTTVTVSLATRTVTISGPLPIVTQLGTINYSLQLSFTVGGTGTQITV